MDSGVKQGPWTKCGLSTAVHVFYWPVLTNITLYKYKQEQILPYAHALQSVHNIYLTAQVQNVCFPTKTWTHSLENYLLWPFNAQ